MNKILSKRIAPCALVLGILMSGCGEKSGCEIPSRHVHKYKKNTNGATIERYIDSENLDYWGYSWDKDYIEINKTDEKIFKLFSDNGIFDGVTNWDYLFNKMASNHDYLMFYYEYTTTEYYTETDKDGNTETKTRIEYHHDWHTDPYDFDNTGATRLYHHRYYGYRIINDGDKYKLEKSPLVDDIRDIINDYQYFKEDCVTEVYEQYRFKRSELVSLSPEDFDDFNSPDLSNREINKGKAKVIEKKGY